MTGSEILSLPVGCERLLVSSDSASWICSRILWQRVRNAAPSAVRLTFLVLRLNSRTPSLCSSRATFLPTAEADMPSSLAA